MRQALFSGVAGAALAAGMAQAQDLAFPIGEGEFSWASYEEFADAHDLSGQSISVFGPWLSNDEEMVENVLAYFAEATGAQVNYSGSDSFEQQIVIDSEGGSPPNIAVFPQPGLLEDMAERGLVEPMPEGTADWLRETYAAGESWVDLATFPGEDGEERLYGLFYKVDVKSLVWYVPENFEAAGYEVPETYEELKELTETMAADGGVPWCIGLGAGGGTGWPATDWVEDLMLRLHEPEVYDQWVSNEIPFDDPRVIEAIEEFGWFARNPDFVAGGTEAVASTDYRDSPGGLFEFPPQCYMHKQASFIPAFFPEDAEVGTDVDFFYFPAAEDGERPVLGAGTVWGITEANEATGPFIDFLQTPIAHELWMAQRGFLTPHQEVNLDVFGDPTLQRMNEILLEADIFRFDASDLMPGPVGAGSFWTAMVDYVGGADAEEVAGQVQRSWNSIQ